jgi:sec-independent protein translocase protein TatB
MFDISFAELMMIAIVGLLVIGPDKLPQVARSLGAFIGRLQRYIAQVKEEINREARFEDLQKLQQEIKDGARQAQASIMEGVGQKQSVMASMQEHDQQHQVKTTKLSVKKTTIKKASVASTAAKKLSIKKSTPLTKNKTVKTPVVSAKIEKA